MKRKKKTGEEYNVISTQDIFLGTDQNSSLDDHIKQQDEDIKKLKQWTKWYVKYGGMGSGSGSGSSSQEVGYNVYIKTSTDSRDITGADKVNLWGIGTYELYISLTKTQGHSFTVTYKLGNSNEATKLIPEGNTTCSISLRLSERVQLAYKITDNSLDEDVCTEQFCTLIPESYSITPSIIYTSSELMVSNSGAISYEALTENVSASFDYTISDDIEISYNIKYKLEDDSEWSDLPGGLGKFPYNEDGSTSKGTKRVSLESLKELLNKEDVLSKKISIELVSGQNLDTAVGTVYSLTIVPQGYYVLFGEQEGSQDTIYPSEIDPSDDSVNKIKKGLLPFTIDLCSEFSESQEVSIEVYKKSENNTWIKDSSNSAAITTNTVYSIATLYRLNVSESGVFKIVGSFNKAVTTKYFCVEESSENWSYTQFDEGKSVSHYYYNNGTVGPFLNSAIEVYNESVEVTDIVQSTALTYNIVVNAGIQYDATNDDNYCFLQLNTDYQNIYIYQNKVMYGTTNLIKEYYFPKTQSSSITDPDKWHLLTVNIGFVRKSDDGNQGFYEISIYIDGVLEGVGTKEDTELGTTTAFNNDFKVMKVVLNPDPESHPQVLKLNLLDVAVFGYNETFYEVDSTMYGKFSYLYDNYATTYFNKYKDDIGLGDSTIDSSSFSANILGGFSFNEFGVPYTTSSTLGNLINSVKDEEKLLKVPILVICPDETSSDAVGKGNFFTDWFLSKWPEDTPYEQQIPTSLKGYIYYVPANEKSDGGLSDFKVVDDQNREVGFEFEIQGSSTRAFGNKNIELTIVSNTDGVTRVFTPNFDKDDVNSFLPEESFTLKADMVDSSACNNNSIGAFINSNTSPLDPDNCEARKHSTFKNYIKNCLTGTPILLFINLDSGTSDEKFYFAGIYNFNLGRKSYFNLGYYKSEDYDKIESLVSDGKSGQFRFLDIATPHTTDNLTVTEISNGNKFYDFSQFDSSILFSDGDTDKYSMFSLDDSIFADTTRSQQILQRAVKQISLSGGYIFDSLGKNLLKAGWIDALTYFINKNGESLNYVPDYKVQYKRTKNESEYTEKETIEPGTLENLIRCIGIKKDEDGEMKSITPYINLRSLVEYYVICMSFGMTDSVLKNLELKSWGAGNYTDEDNITPATLFPAFYDMDTALGVDNNGDSVNYFAFSDYWKNSEEELEDNLTRSNGVTIYPDFYYGTGGYDTPSSFLFAIAKYATMEIVGISENLPTINSSEAQTTSPVDLSPVNLYSIFRGLSGDLRNADYFITKYFNRLGNIPNSLKNLNYRSKYAKIAYWGISGFNSSVVDKTGAAFTSITVSKLSDISKFKGTGLAKKTAWLTSRLRLLDAYFNINANVKHRVSYAEITGGIPQEHSGNADGLEVTWKFKQNGEGFFYYPQNTTGVQFGSDITLNQQIFSASNGTKSSLSVNNFYVKAPSYTPVILYQPNEVPEVYLIGDDTGATTYSIPLNTVGNQTWSLFGSTEFSYISNLGLVRLRQSTITSSKLSAVTYTTDPSISEEYDSFTVDCKNASSITFYGKNYSGSLTIKNGESYGRLETIDLRNSKINCTYEGSLPVKKIQLDNIVSDKIYFPNISNKFTTAGLDGASIDVLGLPLWQSSVSITGNDSSFDTTKNYNYHSVSIKTLTITKGDRFSKSKLELHTLNNLETLSTSGIEELYIYNCPALKRVTISSSLKKLVIEECSSNSNSLTVSSDTAKYIDLSVCSNLSYLKVSNTVGFTGVNIGSNSVIIPEYGFYNTSIVTLDNSAGGKYLLQGTSIFKDDTLFTLKSTDGSYPNVLIDNSDISYCFYAKSGNIRYDAANNFFTNNYSNNCHLKATNINYLFGYQSNIGTDWSFDKKFTYLSKFTNITSAVHSFIYCGINYWSNELFNFGSNSLDMRGCFYCSGGVNVKVNFLSEIGAKLTSYSDLNDSGSGQSEYKVFDSSETELTEVKLYDIVQYLVNITSISGFRSFVDTITVDLKDCFKNCENITSITQFMYGKGNWKNLTYTETVDDVETPTSCLRSLGGLSEIGGCFSYFNENQNPIDLYNLFTEDQWKTIKTLFDWNTSYFWDNFSCNKTITLENFNRLKELIVANTNIKTISNIFCSCNITDCNGTYPVLVFPYEDKYTKITSLYKTFYNLKAWENGISSKRVPVSLVDENDETPFYTLTNVTTCFYTYYGNWIYKCIPFNFFNQRKTINTTGYFPNIEQPKDSETGIYAYSNLDTTTYEYVYYKSNSLDNIAQIDSATIDNTKSAKEQDSSIVITTDKTGIWTTKVPTFSKEISSSSGSSNSIKTSKNGVRAIWRSKRTKPATSEDTYGDFDTPELLERFNDPIVVNVRYALYNDHTKVSNIRGMFGSCRYTIPYFKYDESLLDLDGQTGTRSYIKNGGTNYNYFYTDEDCKSLDKNYRESTEITDLEVGRESQNVDMESNPKIGDYSCANFDLAHGKAEGESGVAYPFIATDFFLGVSPYLYFENLFYSEFTTGNAGPIDSDGESNQKLYARQLEGYIPEHLLRSITSFKGFSNWMANTNIVPVRYLDTDNYVFVPQNFIPISLGNFSNLLNFHIRVPSYSTGGGTNKVYYVMYSNSIISSNSSSPSLSGTLPTYALRGSDAGSCVINTHSPINAASTSYNFNYRLIFNTAGGGSDGYFDTCQGFKNAIYAGLISKDLATVLCGYIWSEDFPLSSVKNNSKPVIIAPYYTHGLNRNMILPKTTKAFNSKFFGLEERTDQPIIAAYQTVNDSESIWISSLGEGKITFVN